MALSAGQFQSQLEGQREYCRERSPFYAGVLAALADDLQKGGRGWWEPLSASWKYRPFETPYEAPLLLLACLHEQALKGEAVLAPGFPDSGKEPAEGPARVLAFLRDAPDEFWETLGRARLQTNEAGRSVGWLLVAAVGFLTRGTPFHLVDMGTSGGLNLVGDYLDRPWALRRADGEPAAEPPRWRESPFPVLSRTGLDARPLDLAEPEERLWLKACIWPDDPARLARFEKAADLVVKLARAAGGPRFVMSAFEEMPAKAAKLVAPHPDEGLLLFNSQASDFLSDAEYEQLRAAAARAMEPWGDRAFWAELELPRGDRKAFHQLRVHRLVGGKLETRALATMTAHPNEVRLLPGWEFLAPQAPVRPPRITIEEPPKQLEPGIFKFPMPKKDG